MYQFYISCAHGLEELLSAELSQQPVSEVKLTHGGVTCKGDLAAAYSLCLNLRTASRVLLHLHEGPVSDRESLLRESTKVPWGSYVNGDDSFVVRFSGTNDALRHTGFSAQVVKDGYLDYWRTFDQRPAVDRDEAGVMVVVQLGKENANFYLDLSGSGMHERGYRHGTGQAPIRETLAAAVVQRSLNSLAEPTPSAVVDPFCGSGTLLLEAAMLLTDCAPGLLREHWGFFGLKAHDQGLWEETLAAAEQRFAAGKASCTTTFYGSDLEPKVLAQAAASAELLGLADLFQFERLDAATADLVSFVGEQANGLLVTNPPYGERLETPLSAHVLFRNFGAVLYQLEGTWNASVLAPSDVLLKSLRLRAWKKYNFNNGPISVRLAVYKLEGQKQLGAKDNTDIANRLKKNWQQRRKWAKREGVEAFRVYDADLPDYNAAIDYYNDHLVVQEYAAPADIPDHVAENRFWDLIDAILAVLPIDPDNIHTKQRRRQKGLAQYNKKNTAEDDAVVFQTREYNAAFWVNMTQYLDTGLFLDHRLVRKDIQKRAANKRVLNLFGYTGSASVHAALGGATEVTTVDMSRTYLNWAKDNFRLNHLTINKHAFIQADCLQWLSDMQGSGQQWDLIFLDPPTFSNSKRMEDTFDIQRDHLDVLRQVKSLLAPGGLLIFSTNKRRFKLDQAGLAELALKADERTHATTSEDFKRQRAIHYCWYIEHA
ncbi:bifunctional 23S rRNA (guanine(2069)-N(7))-methyltransferase RlmK/23S rRNA (guanine(2445)-N(2))-methyltransferase RlmL [Aliidiomarina taiwanensis]|nr:bifunctional 23S rRNA (guanine(2069)-N(7))-methyltransferase RlmK/23S rRNA (guanine(2445)-N(2))-methyltransferase RlmL [Aliidiomarina taiwanensis]